MLAVELEDEPRVGSSTHPLTGEGFTLEGVDHRPVPAQSVDRELGPVFEDTGKVGGQLRWPVPRPAVVPPQRDPAVDLPADDHNRVTGLGDRIGEGREVVSGVDQEGETVGPPTDRRRRGHGSPAPS